MGGARRPMSVDNSAHIHERLRRSAEITRKHVDRNARQIDSLDGATFVIWADPNRRLGATVTIRQRDGAAAPGAREWHRDDFRRFSRLVHGRSRRSLPVCPCKRPRVGPAVIEMQSGNDWRRVCGPSGFSRRAASRLRRLRFRCCESRPVRTTRRVPLRSPSCDARRLSARRGIRRGRFRSNDRGTEP